MGYISDDTRKVTTHRLIENETERRKISMLTSYDYTMAQIVDGAGVDVILVGDSASNVMAGNVTTLPITLDQMIYHGKLRGSRCEACHGHCRHAFRLLSGQRTGGIGFRYPYYERKPCRRPQTGGRRGNHRYGEAYPQRRYSHHGTSRTDAPIHQQVWNIYGPCQG